MRNGSTRTPRFGNAVYAAVSSRIVTSVTPSGSAGMRANFSAARVDGEDGHLQRLAPGLRADPAEARLELPRPVRRGALRGGLRARIDLAGDGEAAFDHPLDADGVDELGAERAEIKRE